MPVKLASKLPGDSHDEARIEIVPLIDIMFFLLASFMLVSLSMVNLKSVKVNLPPAATAGGERSAKDFTDVTVDEAGAMFLDKQPIGSAALTAALRDARRDHPNLRVLISGDTAARHGDVIRALDCVRAAGVEKVAFETRAPASTSRNQP